MNGRSIRLGSFPWCARRQRLTTHAESFSCRRECACRTALIRTRSVVSRVFSRTDALVRAAVATAALARATAITMAANTPIWRFFFMPFRSDRSPPLHSGGSPIRTRPTTAHSCGRLPPSGWGTGLAGLASCSAGARLVQGLAALAAVTHERGIQPPTPGVRQRASGREHHDCLRKQAPSRNMGREHRPHCSRDPAARPGSGKRLPWPTSG